MKNSHHRQTFVSASADFGAAINNRDRKAANKATRKILVSGSALWHSAEHERDFFLSTVKYDSAWVRLYGSSYLLILDEPIALPSLEELSRDKDPYIRAIAGSTVDQWRLGNLKNNITKLKYPD